MMDMMNITGPSFITLWAVHILSVIIFFVGVLFLILWAAKTLAPAQLKTWGIVLAVIGTIACLLTIGVRGAPWVGFGINNGGMGMMGQMRERMMDHDEGSTGEEHEEHEGMENMMRMMMGMGMEEENGHDGSMTMDDMTEALEGKTGDAFDAAFIEGMIPHHQGAIDMAEAALQSARHDEIRAMARAIISAQQKEIDQMREWQRSWGYTR